MNNVTKIFLLIIGVIVAIYLFSLIPDHSQEYSNNACIITTGNIDCK